MARDDAFGKKWAGKTARCNYCGKTWTTTVDDDFTFVQNDGRSDNTVIVTCPDCGHDAQIQD